MQKNTVTMLVCVFGILYTFLQFGSDVYHEWLASKLLTSDEDCSENKTLDPKVWKGL